MPTDQEIHTNQETPTDQMPTNQVTATDQEILMEDPIVMLQEEVYPGSCMTIPVPPGQLPVLWISPEVPGKEVLAEILTPLQMWREELPIDDQNPSVDPA